MLNIPEAVKTLFKTDSVRKNFRVHFPNSEYRDLTNSDIVAGSVKFTESVCSKDVLQFGLAEASRIEFECVGVPNIYGATIECFCEVDTSSLSAEYQTVKADVSYPVYAVPYGSFRVQSCPRNAGAMTHRRVEAYTVDSALKMSQLLQAKLSAKTGDAERTQNPFLLVASEINSIDGLHMTENSVSENYSTMWDRSGPATKPVYVKWSDGSDLYEVRLIAGNVRGVAPAVSNDTLYRFTATADLTSYDSFVETLKSYNASDYAINLLRKRCLPGVSFDGLGAAFLPTAGIAFDNPEDSGYIYPFLNSDTASVPFIIYFTGLYGTIEKNGSEVYTINLPNPVSNVSFKSYTLNDADIAKAKIRLKGKQETPILYTYIDSIDIRSLVEGCFELNGQFLQNSREGGAKKVTLSKASPIVFNPSDYSDMWWDEYDIAPIGNVKVAYQDIDLNTQPVIDYTFGDGLSTYDMTNNYLLINLSVKASDLSNQTVQEYVQTLLDSYFIPNIADIAFTPVDLDALGLPYLEAGDYIEVTAEDGTVVGTYIMARTLTGEQYLEDSIESNGGEIIGSNVRSV